MGREEDLPGSERRRARRRSGARTKDRQRGRRRTTAKGVARKLLRDLPNLLKLLFRLLRDARVPSADKLLFGAVLAYVVAPADLLPDFLGFLGMIDDLYLVGLALGRLFSRAGADLLLEHWDGDPRLLGYLIEGVEELGRMLPEPIRRLLHQGAEV